MTRAWQGFALGLVAAAPLLAVRPGAGGMTLELRLAPPELAGPGRGPWVVATFTNASREPLPLCWSEPAGEELSFTATAPGEPPVRPWRDPEAPTVATSDPIRRTWLP